MFSKLSALENLLLAKKKKIGKNLLQKKKDKDKHIFTLNLFA